MLAGSEAEQLMTLEIRVLAPGDHAILNNVAPGVFDNPTDPTLVAQFLGDHRHHLAVAIDRDQVVGFASGVHDVHPDKPPEMWINEVGVAPEHRGQGIGRRLLECLLQHARTLGCQHAWLLTEKKNSDARGLYAAIGGQESADEPVYYSFRLTEPAG